jgi:hypothetical protein
MQTNLVGELCTAAGWGDLVENGPTSESLKEVLVYACRLMLQSTVRYGTVHSIQRGSGGGIRSEATYGDQGKNCTMKRISCSEAAESS